MWPKRVENPVFLLNIYGHYPNLGNVEITRANLSRDGPSLAISLISSTLPYKPPPKWEIFNRVLFRLNFFPVGSLAIEEFGTDGTSTLKMWDDYDAIHVASEGAVRLSFDCQFLYIDEIEGSLVDPNS